jgi:hypothetical protein
MSSCFPAAQFNCMTVQPVMAAERVVFYRERSSSYYAAGPYAVVRRHRRCCLLRHTVLCYRCAMLHCGAVRRCTVLQLCSSSCRMLKACPLRVCMPCVCVQASGVVELPYLVAQATLMVCITYW